MFLNNFRIRNFRSIDDSGPIEVGQRTVLVGRNESGKTNLLLALRSLNPSDKLKVLSHVKDFPRERHAREFSEDIKVVETLWSLSNGEKEHLVKIFPRADNVSEVSIGRRYKITRWVGFKNLPPLKVDHERVKKDLTKMQKSIYGSLKGTDDTQSKTIPEALDILSKAFTNTDTNPDDWADNSSVAITKFNEVIRSLNFSLTDLGSTTVAEIEQYVNNVKDDKNLHQAAINWILEILPKFIYLDDYPELEGHQNIPQYLSREAANQLDKADINFGKLCKVAGLSPKELNDLLTADPEKRQLLVNRAAAAVTKTLRRLWTDRELKVRFNVDADNFDTLISDPTSVYDVEINLNERSRGLKWFFSFYIAFAADTTEGPAENAILLLDEPGLYLHAIAQGNLLDHFATDFKNQIIFTTHSPFMIPVDDLPSVRTLNISQESGTTVTNTPTGDDRTLFPLQTALGYDLSQTLFIGEKNLVVEGVSDFWYLSPISDYLNDENSTGLRSDLTITPAGGAQKVSYMVALLTSQKLKFWSC